MRYPIPDILYLSLYIERADGTIASKICLKLGHLPFKPKQIKLFIVWLEKKRIFVTELSDMIIF